MWTKTVKKEYQNITQEDIWNTWKDVENRPRWSSDMESCTLQGGFKDGSVYHMKLKGMPAVNLKLSDVVKGCSYTETMQLPGAKIECKHEVRQVEGGIELVDTLSIKGISAQVWTKTIGEKLHARIPKSMDSLVSYIQAQKETV